MFELAKPNLDKSRKRAEAGSKGGKSPKVNGKQNTSKTQAKAENRQAIKDKGQGIKDKGELNLKATSEGMCEQRFEKFWSLYPKKVGIKPSFNAWGKINPDDALFAKIIQALEAARTSPALRPCYHFIIQGGKHLFLILKRAGAIRWS